MNIGKKILSLTLAVAMSVTLLSGCKSGSAATKSVTVNLGSEPPKLNSIITTDTVAMTVLRHTMEGLVTLDQNDKPVAGMAKNWDVSSDGLTYTFHLRDNIKWSNGDAVKAGDFVFAVQSLLTPSFASEYNYMGYYIKNGEEFEAGKVTADQLGIKATDDKTVVVTFATPAPFDLSLLAFSCFMPVNKSYYETQGDQYATESDKMLFNGPYTITKWSHEDELVLTKNPNYYGKKDLDIDTIDFKMIKDSSTALNGFNSGDLDMVGLTGTQALDMTKQGKNVLSYDDGSSWYFEFNFKDPSMANLNVRKALTYSIDRQSFITNVVKDKSKPATSFTAPAVIGINNKPFSEDVGAPLFKDNDTASAATALAAGLKELGKTTLDVTLLTDDTDTAKLYGAFFQEAWKKLGINCTIKSVPFKSRLASMSSGDFQVVLAGWGPDYNDPMTFLDLWTTNGGNNQGKYSNPKVDQLVAQAKTMTDAKARYEILKQIEKIYVDDLAVGPVYFRARAYICSDKLTGVYRSAFDDLNFRWAKVK